VAARPEVVAIGELASLVEFANRPAKPLIVEARKCQLEAIRTEQGGGLDYLLESIATALEDPEYYDALVGHTNFELMYQVPSNQLFLP